MFDAYRLSILIRGNLRHRKRHYLSLIIGILLAVMFISFITLILTSLPASFKAEHVRQYGYVDAVIHNVSDEKLTEFKTNGWLSDVGLATVLGHYTDSNQRLSNGFNVVRLDEKALQLLDLTLQSGRMPERAGEIAIEKAVFRAVGQSYKVGDSITLPLDLLAGDGRLLQSSPVDFTFTLVGLIENKNTSYIGGAVGSGDSNPYAAYPLAYVSNEEELAEGAIPIHTAYLTLSNAFRHHYQKMDLLEQHSFLNNQMAEARIFAYGLGGPSNPDQLIILVLLVGIVVVSLIVAASIGIANSYALVLEERTQQIGLLRAVGMTKGQLRRLYRKETFIITLIAIPAGLLLAAGLVKVFSLFVDKFVFAIHPLAPLAVIVISLIVIFLTGFFPLRRATSIPPMQAIRNVDVMRKLTPKRRIKSHTTFVPERLFTKRHVKLYRGQRIRVGIFVAFTVLLSVLLTSLGAHYLHEYSQTGPAYAIVDQNQHISFIDYTYQAPGYSDSTIESIISLPSVKSVFAFKDAPVHLLVNKMTPYLDPPLFEPDIHKEPRENPMKRIFNAHYGFDSDFSEQNVVAFEPAILERISDWLYEGTADLEAIDQGKAVLLYLPAVAITQEVRDGVVVGAGSINASVGTKPYGNTQILENDFFRLDEPISIRLMHTTKAFQIVKGMEDFPDDVEIDEFDLKVSGFIDHLDVPKDDPLTLSRLAPGTIITSYKGLEALGINGRYDVIWIYLDNIPDKETESFLTERLTDLSYQVRNGDVMNFMEWQESFKRGALTTMLSLGAVLIVFLSISISMISHNIAARIRADKRVIGTMRAVGAAERVIQRSIFYQILNYIFFGSLISYVSGLIFMYVVRAPRTMLSPISFLLPPLFIFLLIGVTTFSARQKVKKIYRKSIIDNIRQLAILLLIFLAAGSVPFIKSADVSAATPASPRVLITDYALEGQADMSVLAGDEVTLNLTLANVQASQLARNIVLTLSTPEDALVPKTVSSQYVDLLLALESQEISIPLSVLEQASPGMKKIDITVEYEDIRAVSYSSTQQVFLTVKQDVRLEHDELNYDQKLTQGNVGRFELNVMNMGKGSINNALLKTNIPGISEGISAFAGTIASGESKTITLNVHIKDSVSPASYPGHVELLYEGEDGKRYQKELPVELTISEKRSLTNPADTEPDESKNRLPVLWLAAGGAVILLLLILLIIQSRRVAKLKRAEEARL